MKCETRALRPERLWVSSCFGIQLCVEPCLFSSSQTNVDVFGIYFCDMWLSVLNESTAAWTGHACFSNVALIHLCWCGLFQVCAVWFADQQTKVKLSPSSTILFAANICRLRGEATSVHLRLICSSDESRKLAAASWSYSCFSKGRGRSESDTAILSLTVPPSSGAFWSGLGSRWSRAQILPGACWARDNLS